MRERDEVGASFRWGVGRWWDFGEYGSKEFVRKIYSVQFSGFHDEGKRSKPSYKLATSLSDLSKGNRGSLASTDGKKT